VYRGLLESLMVIVLAVLGMADAWRLSGVVRGGRRFHDVIGPDRYLGAISIGLFLCGVWKMMGSLKSPSQEAGKTQGEGEGNVSMVFLVIFVLFVYSILLPILGYLLSTLIFFPVLYFIFGVRSWVKSLVLGLLTAGLFYAIFAYFAEVPLPKGFLGNVL
jgi:hypothetical protein